MKYGLIKRNTISSKNLSRVPKLGAKRWFQRGSPVRYEWNDGELIKFEGMNKKQVYIYDVLAKLFSKKGLF